MISEIYETGGISPNISQLGGKAFNLKLIANEGYSVPKGFILTTRFLDTLLEYNHCKGEIENIYQSAILSLEEKSLGLRKILSRVTFPPDMIELIKERIQPGMSYAVRSSSVFEDSIHHSFAGLFESYVYQNKIEDIIQSIQQIYLSTVSIAVLSYCDKQDIAYSMGFMAVIIQEMIVGDMSGVIFTIDPTTGRDTMMMADIVTGDLIKYVNGQTDGDRFDYDFYQKEIILPEKPSLLDISNLTLERIFTTALELMIYFGYPVDIEFTIKNSDIYILQTRAITTINHLESDIWTNANFRDGGVASGACPTMLTSLYDYSWDYAYKKFLIDAHMLPLEEIRQTSKVFYARPYWNISVARKAFGKIPGFSEKEYFDSLGLHLQPDLESGKITIGKLVKFLSIATHYKKFTGTIIKSLEASHADITSQMSRYEKKLYTKQSIETREADLLFLMTDLYLQVEGNYFIQAFINIVEQSLYESFMKKIMSRGDMLISISALSDISHLRPIGYLLSIKEAIIADTNALHFWSTSSPREIKEVYSGENPAERDVFSLDLFRKFIDIFGYHKKRELDILCPSYQEYLEEPIKILQDLLKSPVNAASLEERQINQCDILNHMMETTCAPLSKRKRIKTMNKWKQYRYLLWWREELKDSSTRIYTLLRLYLLKIGEAYVAANYINQVDDIFFLSMGELEAFIRKELKPPELTSAIQSNADYYAAYVNYQGANEIGVEARQEPDLPNCIQGLSCNPEGATGRVKVLDSLEDIDTLEANDILVTPFTDTGWSSKLPSLAGVITETGGVLCHLALISRELGIPCVVAVEHATKRFQTGDIVTIDGRTGKIYPKQ